MSLFDCYRCCAAFRPRYKRLVDNIYPVNPQDGLIRANLDKLIFYACSSPEKLDRIGEYLAQRVNRDIYRRRYAFINLSMEAMDQLLVSCHTRAINLYLESFLKTIESLLESDAPELKILASQSFYRFANIEEDMPSYHRRYAFFVQSFSQLCHCVHKNTEVTNRLRIAGLKGIQGVVRKTCSEDLTESIWNAERMNLIIPSLLFNMQDLRSGGDRRTPDFDSRSEQNDPATIAESCLCEIVKRTPFGSVEMVVNPVLDHLDNHELWIPNDFAMYAVERIMYTIPVHLAYKVIQIIMGHLEASRDKPAQIRIHINNVLTKAISIATGDGAGPSVLVIVDGLLKQLGNSFSSAKRSSIDSDDLAFKDGIIKTLADFSKECPDFQKTDILTFILNKIPTENEVEDRELQRILLEAVARVAAYYKTVQLNNIFKNEVVVDKLSYVLLSLDVATRLLAHEIIHSLLDRHQNLSRMRKISLPTEDADVTFASPARYDVQFFRKYGKDLLETCRDSLNLNEVSNKCVESVYTTFALMIAEISCQETTADFVHSILNLQDVAYGNISLDPNVRNNLHFAVLCLLRLLSLGIKVEELLSYTRQVETARTHHNPEMLPIRSLTSTSTSENIHSDCLLERGKIAEILKTVGWDSVSSQLTEFSPTTRYSYAESTSGPNTVDSSGVVVELDTPSNSPQIVKRSPSADISFATFKRILSEPAEKRREAKREKWNEMAAFYRTATFTEMMERQLSARYQRTPGIPVYQFKQKHHLEPFESNLAPEEVGNYAIKFPDLFMN